MLSKEEKANGSKSGARGREEIDALAEASATVHRRGYFEQEEDA